jgi:hypothetical protein
MSDLDIDDNPFQSVGSQQLASWTLNLFVDSNFRSILFDDPHAFSMAYAACASAVTPPEELIPAKSKEDIESLFGLNNNVMRVFKDLTRQFGNNSITGKFAEYYEKGYTLYSDGKEHHDAFQKWQERAAEKVNNRMLSVEANIDRLGELLDLNKIERDILVFQMLRQSPCFNELFTYSLQLNESLYTLSKFFQCSLNEVSEAFSEESQLLSSGLVHAQQRPFKVDPPSRYMIALMIEKSDSDAEFRSRFVDQLVSEPDSTSLARFQDQDKQIMETLLKMPIPDQGTNILVYGSKVINKKELLQKVVLDQGLKIFEANVKEASNIDIPAIVYIAQRYLEEQSSNDVLVIDKAEQAFSRRENQFGALFSLFGESEPEPEKTVNTHQASDIGLFQSSIKCIWLTSQPNTLSENNLAKFLYHCEALPGSRSDRRERVDKVVKEYKLSNNLQRELSKYNLLGELSVRQAALVASLIKDYQKQAEENDKIPFSSEDIVLRAVQQSQKILNREETEDLRDSVTEYSLDNLNLEGVFMPDRIIKALKKKQQGNICFYGLPGSGKTQLVEYMAVELDKPLIIKRASDLLDKWLGESEKRIADMFREAEAEGAILFLDEADSFLRDRSLARDSWQVTQVNELLQNMERFPGIFVAATNLFQDIDAAALRRFSWKLEFLPLKPEQAWRMFCIEAGLSKKSINNHNHKLFIPLTEIDNLTPGDFATVKRQAVMLGEDFTAAEWLEQLEAEAKAKMAGLKRHKVGFGE